MIVCINVGNDWLADLLLSQIHPLASDLAVAVDHVHIISEVL